MKQFLVNALLFSTSFLVSCASVMPASDKTRCEERMDQAWQQLTEARLTSVSSAWQLTKASKFLAQAKVKYETERYELCIEKAETASELISQLNN
ncbi:MAG: hypothetical protein IME93_07525 [Proteobacteria bacterium]|nr:hypothetical protein [Pseudomonadota bacterium]